jgi:hypothetical protein
MTKKRVFPRFVHPQKPPYADIKWHVGSFRLRNKPQPNLWTPDIVLDPWLHHSTHILCMYKDSLGRGPRWTNPYELQEFVMNYLNNWPLTHLAKEYNLTNDQVRTLVCQLSMTVKMSPIGHFMVRLATGGTIHRPDLFIPNPFPPDSVGCIGTSYAFYRVPDFKPKEQHGDYIAYCPQTNRLIRGDSLDYFAGIDFEAEYQLLQRTLSEYANDDVVAFNNGDFDHNISSELGVDDPRGIHNVYQMRYRLLERFLTGKDDSTIVRSQGEGIVAKDRLLSETTYRDQFSIVLDPKMPGRNVWRQSSTVRLYNQVWTEELIKRTMWDRVTEHSLCMFNDSVHDRARRWTDPRTGAVHDGHSKSNIHRRDYLQMPIKIRNFLYSIGVKGKFTDEFSLGGDKLHPIFDYLLTYKPGTGIIPFRSYHCNISTLNNRKDKLRYRIEANAATLRLTEEQWVRLTNYCMEMYSLLNY